MFRICYIIRIKKFVLTCASYFLLLSDICNFSILLSCILFIVTIFFSCLYCFLLLLFSLSRLESHFIRSSVFFLCNASLFFVLLCAFFQSPFKKKSMLIVNYENVDETAVTTSRRRLKCSCVNRFTTSGEREVQRIYSISAH